MRMSKILCLVIIVSFVSCNSIVEFEDFDTVKLKNRSFEGNCGLLSKELSKSEFEEIRYIFDSPIEFKPRMNHASFWSISFSMSKDGKPTKTSRIWLEYTYGSGFHFQYKGQYFKNKELAKWVLTQLEVKFVNQHNTINCEVFNHYAEANSYFANNKETDSTYAFHLGMLTKIYLDMYPSLKDEVNFSSQDSLMQRYTDWVTKLNYLER